MGVICSDYVHGANNVELHRAWSKCWQSLPVTFKGDPLQLSDTTLETLIEEAKHILGSTVVRLVDSHTDQWSKDLDEVPYVI